MTFRTDQGLEVAMSTAEEDPLQETSRHVGAVVRAAAVGIVELGQVRARRQVDLAHHQAAQLRADAERARAQLATGRAAAVADKQASRLGPPAGNLAPPAPELAAVAPHIGRASELT
jgi:hypothetical protein